MSTKNVTEWQPIETAPEGEWLLLYWPDYDEPVTGWGHSEEAAVVVGYWHSVRMGEVFDYDIPGIGSDGTEDKVCGVDWVLYSDTLNETYGDDMDRFYGKKIRREFGPTHWMSLPNAPSVQEANEKGKE